MPSLPLPRSDPPRSPDFKQVEMKISRVSDKVGWSVALGLGPGGACRDIGATAPLDILAQS